MNVKLQHIFSFYFGSAGGCSVDGQVKAISSSDDTDASIPSFNITTSVPSSLSEDTSIEHELSHSPNLQTVKRISLIQEDFSVGKPLRNVDTESNGIQSMFEGQSSKASTRTSSATHENSGRERTQMVWEIDLSDLAGPKHLKRKRTSKGDWSDWNAQSLDDPLSLSAFQFWLDWE